MIVRSSSTSRSRLGCSGLRQGGREIFLRDPLLQSACLWRLQTLVESASNLSAHIQSRHPEIDWNGLRGFRNIVVHGYLGQLDLDLTWGYLERDVEPLARLAEVELQGR